MRIRFHSRDGRFIPHKRSNDEERRDPEGTLIEDSAEPIAVFGAGHIARVGDDGSLRIFSAKAKTHDGELTPAALNRRNCRTYGEPVVDEVNFGVGTTAQLNEAFAAHYAKDKS